MICITWLLFSLLIIAIICDIFFGIISFKCVGEDYIMLNDFC